jgi:NitT/TauT family transport system substrate-binding protein
MRSLPRTLALPLKGGGNVRQHSENFLSPLEREGRGGRGRRTIVRILCSVLFAAVPFLTTQADAADKVKISYVVPTVIYGDLLLGIDKGYFAEEGIEAELVQAGGGAATPALIAGNVQFSGSPAAAISAILKGAKLKVLYITSDRAAYQLWSRPDIKTIEDLKGQAVGVISRGDTTEIAMRYYLVRHNLPEDYVAYVPLGTGPARSAAITSGSYAASLIDKVEIQALTAAGRLDKLHLLIDLHEDVHMTFSGLATSDALIASNPDLVRRALRAIIKGMIYTKKYREETIASVMRHGVADRKAAEFDYDGAVNDLSTVGTMPLEDQQLEMQVRGDVLSIPKEKMVGPAQVFDFSFTEKAGAELKAEKWEAKR